MSERGVVARERTRAPVSRGGRSSARAAAAPVTLDAGIDALGVDLPAAQRAQVARYLAMLARWNAHHNLTAIREPAQMITHHALDALAVLPRLPARTALRVLDVGTGGGIPGMLLAIARPDWRVTMIDASQKKSAFVTQAIIELALPNAQMITQRVEDWRADGDYDIVISRAFSDLATFVEVASRHLAREGRMVAMKGVMPAEEIAALPPAMRVVDTALLQVPGIDAARSVVTLAFA